MGEKEVSNCFSFCQQEKLFYSQSKYLGSVHGTHCLSGVILDQSSIPLYLGYWSVKGCGWTKVSFRFQSFCFYEFLTILTNFLEYSFQPKMKELQRREAQAKLNVLCLAPGLPLYFGIFIHLSFFLFFFMTCLEQFQVYNTIQRKVQIFHILPTLTHAQPPSLSTSLNRVVHFFF